MSSATERAEARRKAILSGRKDRLAKLTSSARGGEDAAVYLNDDHPPVPTPNHQLKQFVGEESILPTPPPLSRTDSSTSQEPHTRTASQKAKSKSPSGFEGAGLGGTGPDPSIWSEEQQRQLLQTLVGGAAAQQQQQPRIPSGMDAGVVESTQAVPEDPLAALMQSLSQQAPGAGFTQTAPPVPPKPKTLLQKLMPVIHLVAAWILLAYFVLWKEPEGFAEKTHGVTVTSRDWWRRWAELAWKSPDDIWGVHPAPFFYAFTTLAIVLHSWRIYSGLDPVQPPTLLALALPQLPPPFPSFILNGLRYLQILGAFLNDLSAVIVVLGLFVWAATWIAQ